MAYSISAATQQLPAYRVSARLLMSASARSYRCETVDHALAQMKFISPECDAFGWTAWRFSGIVSCSYCRRELQHQSRTGYSHSTVLTGMVLRLREEFSIYTVTLCSNIDIAGIAMYAGTVKLSIKACAFAERILLPDVSPASGPHGE